MKILIGGIGQETNMFSTQKVYYHDFHEYTGENVVTRLFPHMTETEKKEIQFVPAVYANITPSGPLDQSEFQIFIRRFFDAIPNPREIDAIYLCLHGAMYVTGIGSGEAYLLSQVRKVFGKRILISASFDFHGNMSPETLRHLNLCTAYRTAPHIDEQETRSRALHNLIYCYKKHLCPRVSMVQIPVVLPGEKVITADPPCCQMIQRVNRLMERENVIDASLLCGFAWADHNYITMSITISRTEPQAGQAELLEIADSIWSDRDRFSYSVDAKGPMEAIHQAIQEVQKDPELKKPVFLSDSGDNITAGAAGDRTDLLQGLIKEKAPSTLVLGITDQSAAELFGSLSSKDKVSFSLGGSIDPQSGSISVQGTLLRYGQLDLEKKVSFAIVDIEGIHVVITNQRFAFTEQKDLDKLGIQIKDYKIVVIKLGYLYPEIEKIAGKSILVLSPGNAEQRIEKVPYQNVSIPIFPRDQQIAYAAKDFFFTE